MADSGSEETEINLLDLLKRYMRHVGECEGISFVDRLNEGCSDARFTPAEVALLEKLDRSLWPARYG